MGPKIKSDQPTASERPPETPKVKKDNHWIAVVSIAFFVLLSLVVIIFLYYQNQALKKILVTYQESQPSPTPLVTPTQLPEASPHETPKLGWQIYKNADYNFEFSYPTGYKVLTDEEDLYGWPKAILLLYKGGQSYDLAIEVWDTKSEYEQKYAGFSDFSVFETEDNKFITLLNQNKDLEVAEIISTFKFSD